MGLAGTINDVCRALQLMTQEAEDLGMTAYEYQYWCRL